MAVALAVVGLAFAVACWRIGLLMAEVVKAWAANDYTLNERRVAVEERRIALEEAARAPRKRAEPMPPDLRARIGMLDEEWAREDEERTLSMLYAEYDDWEKVRQNLRPLIAQTDPMSVERPFAEPFGQ